MSRQTFRLAMVQMKVEGGRSTANLARAEQLAATAAGQGAQVILFPEAMDVGWTHAAAEREAGEIPGGAFCSRLQEIASRWGVYLCAGLTERDGKERYNAAVLIDPQGRLRLKHRKINELDIAHDRYSLGGLLGVSPTEYGRFGLMICADAFAQDQVLTRSLAYMGADVILSPCAWAVPADHDPQREPYGALWRENYQPVARDFAVWIAGVSNVGWIEDGPWTGWKCIGCSLLIGPDGNEILQGPYGHDAETILYADIQARPRPARGDQWPEYWKRRGA